MSEKMMRWILFGSISAVVLGAGAGYWLPEFMLSVDFLGSLFFNALRLIIVPLIVTSLVTGIVSLGDVRKVGRTALSTLTYFMATTSIAVIIGLALVLIFKPGDGVSSAGAILPSVISNLQTFDPGTFITSLIPSSIPQAIIGGNYLGIIVVSIIFSFVLIGLGTKGKQVVQLFETFNEIVFKLVYLLLLAAPVGLFVLIGSVVAQNRDSLGQLAAGISGFAAVLLGGFLIHGLIVLPLIMKRFSGKSPISAFSSMLPALTTAFGTASSSAALGITCHCVIDKGKVDRRAASFVLPIGAVINVDATAMYAVVATFFVAQVFGISLSLSQMLLVSITAIVASIGLAGLPFGAIFLSAILFGVADFPPQAYAGLGLVFAVDWLFDRLRAALNIWGDAIGAIVVAGTFEFKTVRATRNLRTDRRSSPRPEGLRRTERSPRRTDGRSSRPDRDSRPPRDRDHRNGRTEQTDPGRRTGRPVRPRDDRPERDDRRPVRSRDSRRAAPTERHEQETASPFAMSSPPPDTFNIEAPAAVEKPVRKRPQMPAPPDLPKVDKPRIRKKRVTAATSRVTTREVAEKAPSSNGPSKVAMERELSKVAAQLANLDRKKSIEESATANIGSSEEPSQPAATVDFLAAENGTITSVADALPEDKESEAAEPVVVKKKASPRTSRSLKSKRDSDSDGPDKAAKDSPRTDPETSVSDSDTPATEPETPAIEPETPATEAETPATEPETPATEPETPATEPETPVSEPDSPAKEFGRSRASRSASPTESVETDEKQTEELVSADTAYKAENQSFGRANKKRVR